MHFYKKFFAKTYELSQKLRKLNESYKKNIK